MFSLLRLRVFYFPCYVEVSLDSNLERKKKLPKIFQIMLSRMDKCNLVVSTNILLFDVLTMLIHHLVLFFSFLSLKINFCQKQRKKYSVKLHYYVFFRVFCWMDKYFNTTFIYQTGIRMNISNT